MIHDASLCCRSPKTETGSMIQAAAMKVFQFSSELQRMSVIARVVEENRDGSFGPAATLAFCKGSPEAAHR